MDARPEFVDNDHGGLSVREVASREASIETADAIPPHCELAAFAIEMKLNDLSVRKRGIGTLPAGVLTSPIQPIIPAGEPEDVFLIDRCPPTAEDVRIPSM